MVSCEVDYARYEFGLENDTINRYTFFNKLKGDDEMSKTRMSNKKFLLIILPIIVVLLALVITVTAVMNYWAGVMDTYLGRGSKIIENSTEAEDWDLKYYAEQYSTTSGESGSQAGAAKIAKQISDEGTVLLKNDGVLPLAKQSKVAPFGYRYHNPFYGGTGSGNMVTTDEYVVTPAGALGSNFELMPTFTVNNSTMVKKYYYDLNDGNEVLYFFEFSNSFNGSDHSIYEFDQSIYNTDSIASGTTGVVFLGRAGGENNDLWTIPYNKVGDISASSAGTSDGKISNVQNATSTDKVRHALDLMPEEEQALALAKEKCDNVVVIINSSNAIDRKSVV